MKWKLVLCVMVCLSAGMKAQQPGNFETNTGQVRFVSTAPMEVIRAGSTKLKGLLSPTDNRFAFSVDMHTFEGFNSELQREHFNENYMESDKYPLATFSGRIIEKVEFDKDQKIQVRAKGILDIHGVKAERIIPVNLEIKKQTIQCSSTFNVMLADHHIVVPKIVHQKIAETVQVTIGTTLKRN